MSKTEKIELTKLLVAIEVVIVLALGVIASVDSIMALVNTNPLLFVLITLCGSTVLSGLGLSYEENEEVTEEQEI